MQVTFGSVIQETWRSIFVNLWLEIFLKKIINLLASWISEDTKEDDLFMDAQIQILCFGLKIDLKKIAILKHI